MFIGCGTAMVTPFRKDGSLDEATLRKLVRRQIEQGIDFLVPCGTTGESPTLSREEHLRVVEITIEESAHKIPVLAGAGGNDTRQVVETARACQKLGADGILSVTPYYNKATQEGLYQHYKAIAAAVEIPIILYSVQGRTGVNIEPATVARLAGLDRIIGIKEASGNITQVAEIVQRVPESFIVLSGDDAMTLPVISLGGRGIVSVVSNQIPGAMTQLARLANRGDFEGARKLQRQWLPLMQMNFIEANPIPVKWAMSAMGLLEPGYRLPLVEPLPASKQKIEQILESVGLMAAAGRTDLEQALLHDIAGIFDSPPPQYTPEHFSLFARFKLALNAGAIRAAEPDDSQQSGWRVNGWVKKGILLGFRMGSMVDMSIDAARQPFIDKSTYPVRQFDPTDNVRIVPGGSSIRDGCYIGKGVVCMPPMYVNAGAYVGEGSMIDSHALVGSCAQIGRNCHISAASQIGGVLEPVGALPVIIEDDVLVGGNCGVYEGTVVKKCVVLGTGTILNRSTPLYDLVRGQIYRATDDQPLVVPEGAVVVAGSRAVTIGPGRDWGISIYTPVIAKYRDDKTGARIQLEDLLR